MSIVVVMKKNGVYYMGADTQTTCGMNIERNLGDGYKITRLENGLYIGVCGYLSAHLRLMANSDIFAIDEGETYDKRYVVRNVIPKLYDLLSKNDYLDEDSRKLSSELLMLIVGRGRIFEIRHDLCVVEHSKFGAIGAGSEAVKGALLSLDERSSPNETILQLMRISALRCNTISAPYVLIDTKDNEYRLEVN